MPLFISFGINGSGKDTLAKKLLTKYPEMELLSGSRIMLRGLGFDVGITASSLATKEMYEALEATPEEVKKEMADEVFRDTLLEFKVSQRLGVISSHLIIAKREGGEISYQKDLIRPWFPEVFDGFIYVKGEAKEIFERQEKDKNDNLRDRGLSTIESLEKQQRLSSIEWSKLNRMVDSKKLKTIYNLDGQLEFASTQLEGFVDKRIKEISKEATQEIKNEFKPK